MNTGRKYDYSFLKKDALFGYWKIIDETLKCGIDLGKKGKHKYIKCLCTKCNDSESYIRIQYLLQDNSYKQCNNCRLKERMDSADVNFSKKENQYFSKVKYGAKKRKIPFSITKKYIYNILAKQNNKCAISGKPMFFDADTDEEKASLDRIDASLGYIHGNLQWVRKRFNLMKGNLTEDEFVINCRDVVLFSNKKKKII
jgi:hypothetical protein